MQTVLSAIGRFFRKADLFLLALCVTATLCSIVVISSATAYLGGSYYVSVQLLALLLGIVFFVFFTLLDIEILAERRELLMLFNFVFLGMLLFWGVEGGTGNRSWLSFRFLPFNIQPAELCKITFLIIMAKMMSDSRNSISKPHTLGMLTLHMALTCLWILIVSSDTGVALIYVFVFFIMLFAGGVNRLWFLLGGGATAAAFPLIWTQLLRTDQKNRLLALFDPSIDPSGQGVLYQTNRSLRAISQGGVSGQGLFHGTLTQAGGLPEQHTDFIFSVVCEELGTAGALCVLLLLTAIILRCVVVGIKSHSYLNRLICLGIAGMLLFQMLVNVGMCLGVFPVIGLTLPFFSYGGSSVVTSFLCMGIVSGIHMRPASDGTARYIRPKPEM